MLITGDHGNIECMITKNNKPDPMHTTNPVPLIFIGNDVGDKKLKDGSLADIMPTILNLMNIKKTKEITGNNLISFI